MPMSLKYYKKDWPVNHLRDQHQRNALSKGYKNCSEEDLIMISDIDEIPDPNKINQFNIKNKQCLSNGGMISFDVKGAEKDAFRFLNSLKLIKLAVSLGGTESLAEHPATMTHVDLDPALKNKLSITEKMVRLSIGVEFYEDIIYDIEQALSKIDK